MTEKSGFYQYYDRLKNNPALWGVPALMLAAFLLAWLCYSLEPVFSRDGCLYLELVEIWHQTGSLQGLLEAYPDIWIPPFPLYLMKLLMDFGVPKAWAGLALNMVMFAFLPLIIWKICRLLFPDRQQIAWWTAAFIAVNPAMIDLAIEPQRDMIYLFFCGFLILFLLRGILQRQYRDWLCAGVFFIFSALTRFETWEILPLLAAYFCFALFGKHRSWRELLKQAGLFSVGA